MNPAFMGIDIKTKEVFEAVPVDSEYRFRSIPAVGDGRLFLRYTRPDAFGVLEFDLKNKTLKDLDLSFIDNEEQKYFVDVRDGYTYYVKLTSDMEPYGMFRADEKGNEQDVCALPQNDDAIPFIMGDYVVYRCKAEEFGGQNGLVFVDIESGRKYYLLSSDEIWEEGATIIYEGSESEWQALIKENAERFSDVSVDTSGTKNPVFKFEGK